MESVGGAKLREAGLSHWVFHNTDATNKSGFTLLPAATRNYWDRSFNSITANTYILTSTMYDASKGYIRQTDSWTASITKTNSPLSGGLSVRCLKDN